MTPFVYSEAPHVRRHGPAGYSDYERYRPWLRDEFLFRCVYCLRRERWGPLRGAYHIDHFRPQAIDPHQSTSYNNLLYACASCNMGKGKQIVPNPCDCMLEDTAIVREDGSIQANTPEAAKIIRVLGLDSPDYREFRMLWIGIVQMSLAKDRDRFRQVMGYPTELPDLSLLEPPDNTRPEGIEQSCYARRLRDELPHTY